MNNISKMTYCDILRQWFNSVSLNIKPSTQSRYAHLIKRHIEPYLGTYNILDITIDVLESFASQKLACGRLDGCGGLSRKTVSDILVIIKSSIKYAKSRYNDINCNIDGFSIKDEKKQIRILSIAEQRKLIGILIDGIDECKFGIFLSLYTGIRIGELCALKWEYVSLHEGILRICSTMQRIQNLNENNNHKTKIIITEPKSRNSIREIPLPSFVIDIAKKFVANGDSYVLTGVNNKYMEPRVLHNKFKNICREAGIENISFHSLRHTFATRCIELGFDIKSLSEILGHANINITLERYVHSTFELKRKNMDKFKLDLKL